MLKVPIFNRTMERIIKTKSFLQKKSRSKSKGLEPKIAFTAKNAERERSRVKSLRQAFQTLQCCLPAVPPNTKLSKLDILILATNYILHLTRLLSGDEENQLNLGTALECDLKFLHPIKKWPMRSRLYSISESIENNSISAIEPMNTVIESYYELDSIPNNSLFIV